MSDRSQSWKSKLSFFSVFKQGPQNYILQVKTDKFSTDKKNFSYFFFVDFDRKTYSLRSTNFRQVYQKCLLRIQKDVSRIFSTGSKISFRKFCSFQQGFRNFDLRLKKDNLENIIWEKDIISISVLSLSSSFSSMSRKFPVGSSKMLFRCADFYSVYVRLWKRISLLIFLELWASLLKLRFEIKRDTLVKINWKIS